MARATEVCMPYLSGSAVENYAAAYYDSLCYIPSLLNNNNGCARIAYDNGPMCTVYVIAAAIAALAQRPKTEITAAAPFPLVSMLQWDVTWI